MKAFKKGALTQAEITQWLIDLRPNPSVPESGFHVTAVFRARAGSQDDYYFGGVNVENADHRLTTHGEEGSMAGIVTGLGKQGEIMEAWVMGAPRDVKPHDGSAFASAFVTCCGKCRQQIVGLAGDDVEVHSVSLNGPMQTTTVKKFLPEKFSFRDFMPEIAALQSPGAPSPSAAEVEKKLVRRGPLSPTEIKEWLDSLESVDYVSKVSQAAVVHLDNGWYVAGTKMEEAAFQSMNVAQSAMALATSEFGERKIEEVFVLTKGRDEKKIPAGSYGSLSLSALQTLFHFAANDGMKVHLFNETGPARTLTSAEAVTAALANHKAFRPASP